MASTSPAHQLDANLASRMEKFPSMHVKKIKAFAASNPQDFDVNARNHLGKSALMIACGRLDKKVVEFLLDEGADPNAQCGRGHTAMYHVVCDAQCWPNKSEKDLLDIGKIERKVDILKLLISRGATSMYDSQGFNPSGLAAICKNSDLVNFFVQRNTRYLLLSDEEQIRALEMIGVVTVLDAMHSTDKDVVKGSLRYFSRARYIRKKTKTNICSGENRRSDFAAVFSFFSEKEYTNCAEWKSILNDDWAIRTQAFLIAERVLPELDDIEQTPLLPNLLFHAYVSIFKFGNLDYRRSQGIQILKDALQLELQSKIKLGSVLGCMLYGFRMKSWEKLQLHDEVKGCLPVMYSWLKIFEAASKCRLRAVQEPLMRELGSVLLKLAMSSCHKTSEIFETLLSFVEELVQVNRRICKGGNVASITHHVIVESQGHHKLSNRSGKLNRVKRMISKLVQCEDATHCNAKGETMLHSLMIDHLSSHPQFLKDVALILVRNGCDPKKRNNSLETWEDQIWYSPYTWRSEFKELKEVITRQVKSVLPLEEIAARAILRHNILHEGILPKHLSRIVTGELWQPDDSKWDVNDGQDQDSEYESEYDREYESDYDSDFDILH